MMLSREKWRVFLLCLHSFISCSAAVQVVRAIHKTNKQYTIPFVVLATFHCVLNFFPFSLLFVAILCIIQTFYAFLHPDRSAQFQPYIYFLFTNIHTFLADLPVWNFVRTKSKAKFRFFIRYISHFRLAYVCVCV